MQAFHDDFAGQNETELHKTVVSSQVAAALPGVHLLTCQISVITWSVFNYFFEGGKPQQTNRNKKQKKQKQNTSQEDSKQLAVAAKVLQPAASRDFKSFLCQLFSIKDLFQALSLIQTLLLKMLENHSEKANKRKTAFKISL